MATARDKCPVHILLADDDVDDRYFFDKALGELSIKTVLTTVSNGEQLIDFLHSNSGRLPDVLFLDLNMPRKNGFECLDLIKSNQYIESLPVIIYSTSLLMAVADELYKKGAHYYFQKDTSDLTKLLEYILTLLENNNYRRPQREEFIIDFAAI
jgi:CheY-like chemotaxis protein